MAHFACEENVGNRVCFAVAEEGRQTAQKVPVYQNLRTFFHYEVVCRECTDYRSSRGWGVICSNSECVQ